MSIKLLSPHMADLIAAGEVVERPASAVKELLENAIDSGANKISLEIQNGGITYIRISDNGCGIARDEMKLAFLRHATSKISNEIDLENISSLGFRGEALAAISAVSKITMISKRINDTNGSKIEIISGNSTKPQDAPATDGTSIEVCDLFYNIPARMKFLKKDFTEAGYITSIVEKCAVSHPNIAFKYTKDKKLVFSTNGDGNYLSCIYDIFGKDFASEMIEIPQSKNNGIIIDGYVSAIKHSKNNRKAQLFFVNGRYIKSTLIQSALEQAYKNSLMSGKYPYGIINITINYNLVDVNVHPAKTEIKFSNEKDVFSAIYLAVKNTIEKRIENINLNNLTNSTNILEVEDILDNQTIKMETTKATNYDLSEKTETDTLSKISIKSNASKQHISDAAIKFDFLSNQGNNILKSQISYNPITPPEIICDDFEDKDNIENFTLIGEYLKTYIIIQIETRLILIDKHAAHERIIFNQIENIESHSQTLINPEILEFMSLDFTFIMENINEINKLGFDIEMFYEKSIVVRAIPSYLDVYDIRDVLCDANTNKFDNIKHSIACRAAIKAGNKCSKTELYELAQKVILDKKLQVCPHGRPIIIEFSKFDIEKMFKRVL